MKTTNHNSNGDTKKTKKTQAQMYYDAVKLSGEKNMAFLDMVNDKHNPMTNDDLQKLIDRYPARYGCFSGFIGKLSH